MIEAALRVFQPLESRFDHVRSRSRDGAVAGVPGRSAADRSGEIADEMRLVAVAEVAGETRPVGAGIAGDPYGSLVQAETLDDPLGADADVLREQPLAAALADAEPLGEVARAEQPGVGGELLDDRGLVAAPRTVRSKAAPAGPNTSATPRSRSVIVDTGASRKGRKLPDRNRTPTTRPAPSSCSPKWPRITPAIRDRPGLKLMLTAE